MCQRFVDVMPQIVKLVFPGASIWNKQHKKKKKGKRVRLWECVWDCDCVLPAPLPCNHGVTDDNHRAHFWKAQHVLTLNKPRRDRGPGTVKAPRLFHTGPFFVCLFSPGAYFFRFLFFFWGGVPFSRSTHIENAAVWEERQELLLFILFFLVSPALNYSTQGRVPELHCPVLSEP